MTLTTEDAARRAAVLPDAYAEEEGEDEGFDCGCRLWRWAVIAALGLAVAALVVWA